MKRILIATFIGVSVLSAGCTGGTPGEAKPDPTSGSSTPTDSASKLESIKPCELLSESEATGLGYTHPGDEDFDTSSGDGCDWIVSAKGGTTITIRPKKGIKELNIQGNKVSDIKLGKFDGKKYEGTNGDEGACSLLISVTDSSSVSILSTVGGSTDTAAACERASKVADLVVPKLS